MSVFLVNFFAALFFSWLITLMCYEYLGVREGISVILTSSFIGLFVLFYFLNRKKKS